MKNKALYLLILLSALSTQAIAVNIEISNDDGPGEGFNDPTPASSIPAQKGNNPGTTLGALRLNVFNKAAEEFEKILKSSQTITISSKFDPLPCTMTSGTLGQAGPTSSRANFAGGQAGVAYGIAQAESLAGANLNGASAEINAQFNSDVDSDDACLGPEGFYYGLDGNAPPGMVSLLPVVLHEIAHGLGFLSFADAGPAGTGGFHSAGSFPGPFSRNLQDLDSGKSWDQMNNAERKASALNEPNLVWKGPKVNAAGNMQLGSAPEFVINAPPGIAGIFDTVLGDEPGAALPNGGVTGSVIDGQTFMDLDADLADGCSQIDFGGTFAGKIVLFDATSNCLAIFQALWSQREGAIAVIIVSTEPNGLPDISGIFNPPSITIPYIGVEKSVGDALRSNLATANVTIRKSTTNLMGMNQGKVKMFAPAAFENGSSVSHWDTSATPNLLMEPSVNADLPFLGLDLTPSAFEDTGWPMMSGSPDIPDRPGNVRATDGVFSDRVRVTFNTVPGATVYRVFRCLTKGQTCGLPVGFPKTGTFDDKKGVPGTVYFYRVRACNATKCGKFSLPNNGSSSAAPARPTGVKATDATFQDKVRVTFNTVAGATVYRVFRCQTTGQTCGLPVGFPKNGTFDDKKGVAGTVYYYRVRACTATTCGKFSLPDKGSRSAGPVAPARPTMVRATDGLYVPRVRVTWDKVPGTFVYRVFRCPAKTGDCGPPVGFPKNPVFDDFKGALGVIYYYRVRACTMTTCGKFSVQNPGHRGTIPSARADTGNEVEAISPASREAIPIPVLESAYSRWLLILMMLGMGLVLIRRRPAPARE